MNCKHMKRKLNGSVECSINKDKKLNCSNCKHKSYKDKQVKPIKQRTTKQSKAEASRFSLLTDDLTKCIICDKSPINKHEVFYGRNRQNSIKYGLVIPLCTQEHHNQIASKGIHFDKELNLYWRKIAQKKWIQKYGTIEEFQNIFRDNVL